MALVNALWVKMLWTDPFVSDQTRNTPFHAPGGTHKVPTMHKVEELPYSRARGWSMVSLAGEYGLTMDVLLPDKTASTPPTPTAEDLTGLYRGRRSSRVSLALPRFSVETDTGLLPFLASLGVRDLGTADARFDGISDTPLKVDTLVHQSVLRVNEKGAEGAAATAAIMSCPPWYGPNRCGSSSIGRSCSCSAGTVRSCFWAGSPTRSTPVPPTDRTAQLSNTSKAVARGTPNS